jgi:hypothetical protein
VACHHGADQPEREIVEASRHGAVARELEPRLGLDRASWVLGRDYSAAPTCATCHFSGTVGNGGAITHQPELRLSWSFRGPISLRRDTDASGRLVTEIAPEPRRTATVDSWQDKRQRMRGVCLPCHAARAVDDGWQQLDAMVALYDRKLGQPTEDIMEALRTHGLRTERLFDEPIEWIWFELWHRAGRRARLGAAMMSPNDVMGLGMALAAEQLYAKLIAEARSLTRAAAHAGKQDGAEAVDQVIDGILARPEHAWVGPAPGSSAAAPSK